MKRGEVWWVSFDASLGGEIKKTRPAVIVSNDAANMHLNRVVVVPLSSQVARIFPAEALVKMGETPGKAMADQIMTADKKRLISKMGILSHEDMAGVENALLLHLGMKR